jgi:hypothetical protein
MRTRSILVFGVLVLAAIVGNYAFRTYSAKPQASAEPLNTNQYLETEVQKRLVSSGVFKDDKVSVSAKDGTVTLTGTVGAEWRRISAENIASSTPAVLEVKNLIKVPEPAAVERTPWASDNVEVQETRRKRPVKGFGMGSNDPQTQARELVAQGNEYVAQKNFRAASKAFQSALALDPNNFEARSGLQESQRIR